MDGTVVSGKRSMLCNTFTPSASGQVVWEYGTEGNAVKHEKRVTVTKIFLLCNTLYPTTGRSR